MNLIANIEEQIYASLNDMAKLDNDDEEQSAKYIRLYSSVRGMCRVLCQFTNDTDECDMFDRIQQDVLVDLKLNGNDKAATDKSAAQERFSKMIENDVDETLDAEAKALQQISQCAKKPAYVKPSAATLDEDISF